MNKNLFILVLLFLPLVHKAQTNLTSGDIAFVAINSDESMDDFSFVLLTDIESGTIINFTDNGWSTAGEFNPVYTESHITWTSNSNISAGEVIQVKTYNGVELASSESGEITGDKMTISVAGDQILAYQGDKTDPRFIAAISFNHNTAFNPGNNFDGDSFSNSTTTMPPGLTKGINAIHIYSPETFAEQDNSIYNCSVTNGEKEVLLNAINDVNNWLFDDDTPFNQNPFPCMFTIDLSTDVIEKPGVTFKVFPNPASDFIRIVAQSAHDSRVTVINTAGIILNKFVYPANATEQTYNIDYLPTGIYYLKIQIGDNAYTTKINVVK